MPRIKEFLSELPGSNPTKSNVKYLEEAADLRANPGKWGKVATWPKDKYSAARSTAINIQHGKLKAFSPAGDYEAATRVTPGGGVALWVRYTGPSGDDSDS